MLGSSFGVFRVKRVFLKRGFLDVGFNFWLRMWSF